MKIDYNQSVLYVLYALYALCALYIERWNNNKTYSSQSGRDEAKGPFEWQRGVATMSIK